MTRAPRAVGGDTDDRAEEDDEPMTPAEALEIATGRLTPGAPVVIPPEQKEER